MENLENILESILFVNGDAIDIADITSKIDVDKNQIKNAVKKLKEKYNDKSGIILLEFNNKLQFASNSKYSETVSLVLNPIRQRNLSRATLETASIIAYKQPVTRLEIEEIRGVSSDYAINILMEHNLIEIVGRKEAVGKPALFGTTDEFLKRFNISSIDELPDYNELLERVKVIRSGDDRLYNHFEVKSEDDDDVGGDNKEQASSTEKSIKVENVEKLNEQEQEKAENEEDLEFIDKNEDDLIEDDYNEEDDFDDLDEDGGEDDWL